MQACHTKAEYEEYGASICRTNPVFKGMYWYMEAIWNLNLMINKKFVGIMFIWKSRPFQFTWVNFLEILIQKHIDACFQLARGCIDGLVDSCLIGNLCFHAGTLWSMLVQKNWFVSLEDLGSYSAECHYPSICLFSFIKFLQYNLDWENYVISFVERWMDIWLEV